MSTSTQIGQDLLASYLQPLLAGDRDASRRVVEEALESGADAGALMSDLIWPAMERIQALYRDDRITQSSLNLATRLNRSLTAQLAARLTRKASNGRTALIVCGNAEPEELGGQVTSDLFEADGWTVRFAGGGVPEDEVLTLIGELRPDLLILFGTLPSGMPAARRLIDYLRQVNSCPNMQILCCGGIYKRAEGLADEIGADLFAPDAAEALIVATENPERRATVDQQTVGRTRRIRKAAARKAITDGVKAAG